MSVHDINAKKDAAMLADLRAASTTIEPPHSLDPTTMAVRAVRNVRRRRVVVAVTAGAAALALLGAGIGATATVLGERQPLPGDDRSAVQSAPAESPSAVPSRSEAPSAAPSSDRSKEPRRYLRTGDGELPVLPDVERGVVENGAHAPYILGGLWYEVPAGGWIAVGDVNAGGVAGWLDPDHPRAGGLGEDGTIDDMDATIELRNVFDVAGWTVPARDSGATTLDIEGADLVVIEQHEREGGVRPATIRIRSGEEGWVIDTRFPAGATGETMLRDFVGNLWLKEAGEPDWYQPQFSTPVLDAIEHGVPAGWVETEHNGLRFAVPPGWTSEPTEGEFSPGVEWTGPTVTHVEPGVDAEALARWTDATPEEKERAAQDVESPERVYVQGGKPGGLWWTRTMDAPRSQMIDVPGADYAEVIPTVYNADGEPDYYWVDIYIHQEDRGENLFLVVEFDGTEQGLRDLHSFLGTLDFRR
ncbi:hypothetical protein ACFQHV_12125 [Promicromonospora thailandica]|uniref:Uncharacterized protein n=1 Tax=Promicromonospora thailandica TaxID=765201 RepID=A0A9X2G147_9MICO|nr:hypothetical protein [Promicromonospora thailandica]MCP2265132.1 hypothetical protein [Promicromonospora thailandica]BFF19796.1 hypothetical protein GCM10025730_33170 [Promicromonospora thailandica]